MNGSAFGTSAHKGFTFIEILVALMIITIIAAVSFPRIRYRGTQPLDELVEKINRLTRLAYARAITTGKLHRLLFRMADQPEVILEMQNGTTTTGEPRFAPVTGAIIPSRFSWDRRFEIKHFYIRTIDEVQQGKVLKDAWFFVVPEGFAQDIIIDIHDTISKEDRGLILNPFSVTFSVYDTLQKP